MIERVRATDFCCFEELDQPLSKQGLVFIAGDHRDTSAASSNGAGKTTLFKAITWALYGQTVDEMKGDEVIRLGTKMASVTVTIEDGDTAWHITRTRRKGKPGLGIETEQYPDPERHPVKGSKDELQAKIIEILGLDFRAFKNTVLYGQNDSFKFADPHTKDSERKDMLHRILRTEALQSCHDVAKERFKAQRKKMEGLHTALQSCDSKIEVIDLPSVRRRHEQWEAGRRDRVDRSQEQARRYKNKAQEVLQEAEDVGALTERLGELQTAYEAARAAGACEAAERREAQGFKNKIHEQERAIDALAAEAKQVAKQLERLKGDKCAVCTAPLTSGSPAKHRKHLKSRLVDLDDQVKAAEARIGHLQVQLKAAQTKESDARLANEQAEGTRDSIDELKEAMEAAQAVKGEAQEWIEKAKREVAAAKQAKQEPNPHDEALETAKTRVDETIKAAEGYEEQRTELEEDMAYTQFWVRGYSPQGLPSFLLDAVMPFLTDKANEYLEVLADGDITMSISTQRALKSQKDAVKDEIDINWTIEGNEGVAKSGGQRTKMNLGMDMALMDLAATREGIQLDMLLIDEALDGLDRPGTARVLKLLQKMRSRRGTIFVISHNDDMIDMFEKGIRVIREDGVSRVEAIR